MRDDLSDAAAHKDAVGNKQADVSNEVGGFEHSEGIWVIPSHESLTDRYPVPSHTQTKVINGTTGAVCMSEFLTLLARMWRP